MNKFSAPNALAETLLANLRVGILVYEDAAGKCVLANQAAADMLDESVEALSHLNFQTFASRCRLAETAQHGSLSGHHEVAWQTASDKIITLACCISRFDYEGKPHRLCTVSDITQSRRTQEKLERERALLRCVIDSASDLIFIKDQESVYRACNKASEAFIGMAESEQIGKSDYDFFDREKADQIRKTDREVIDEGKPVHYEEWVTGPDGRRLLIDTVKTPYYDPDGKPLGLVGIGRDLTERNRLEQDRLAHLRYFENMDRVNRAIQGADDLEKMMKHLLEVVLSVFDCDRAYLQYPCDPDAPSWSIPMEFSKPEYPGAGVQGVEIPMDPEVSQALRLLLESDTPVKFDPETKIPLPSKVAERFGIKSSIAISFFPVNSKPWNFGLHQCSHARVWTKEEARLFQEIARRLADGIGVMLAQRDLRHSLEKLDQRVLDRTAQLEAANKELEAFAYSVSHDLRAPLRHIDGFLELLKHKARATLDEQGRHYMDTIANAAQKMGLLIDDLLTFSRMRRHAMSLRQVALGPLVRDVIRELETDAAGRTVAWRIDELPVVRGDKAMLRMVLVNLVANALKFTRPRQQAKIEIGSLPDQNDETVIFVRDNGAGFDMAFRDKLFGVFQRLHHDDEFEGIGIGLANARRIIARHGGRIWAQGEVDQGATFYFALPRKGNAGGG
jgi:PAS domain S-box-containing protein